MLQNHHHPSVIQFPSTLDFLIYTLAQPAPTTILVCSSRETFFQHLLHETQPDHHSTHANPSAKDHLLTPTIRLLAESRKVKMVYVPTLQHLRAYLAAFPNPANPPASEVISYETSGTHVPILALLNSLGLHRSAHEFSVQGLSRTFALVVETAARENMRLLVTECDFSTPSDEAGRSEVQRDPWAEQIPLLSGSIRFGGEDRMWVGKSVEIRKVVSRWCKFVNVEHEERED